MVRDMNYDYEAAKKDIIQKVRDGKDEIVSNMWLTAQVQLFGFLEESFQEDGAARCMCGCPLMIGPQGRVIDRTGPKHIMEQARQDQRLNVASMDEVLLRYGSMEVNDSTEIAITYLDSVLSAIVEYQCMFDETLREENSQK